MSFSVSTSLSGRVSSIPRGVFGGKGDNTILLDIHADRLQYQVPEHSLLIGNETLGLPTRAIDGPRLFTELPADRVSDVIDVLREKNFSAQLAIRSSGVMEDQLGSTAAGRFETEMHPFGLESSEARSAFAANLLSVVNSAYSLKALEYYQRFGTTEIPPLGIIIQDLVGQHSQRFPELFFPTLSGIVQTTFRRAVWAKTVLGLGQGAVAEDWGIFHQFPIGDREACKISYNIMGAGRLNDSVLYALDLQSGSIRKLTGTEANPIFPASVEQPSTINYEAKGLTYLASKRALALEGALGTPGNLEWASAGLDHPVLLQFRPMSLRPVGVRPAVDAEKILIDSHQVVGFGEHEFDHIIYVDYGASLYTLVYEHSLEMLTARVPNSLILIHGQCCPSLGGEIWNKIIPNKGVYAVAVIDTELNHESEGITSLEHLGADSVEQGKQLIIGNPENLHIVEKLLRVGHSPTFAWNGTSLVPYQSQTPREMRHCAHIYTTPVRTVCDDDAGWGMVYLPQ